MNMTTQSIFDRLDALIPSLPIPFGQRARQKESTLAAEFESAPPDPIKPLRPRLVIPMVERTDEEAEREAQFERAQKLARQDRWDDLHDIIKEADENRLLTPAGTPVADLLAFGARADIVAAATTAVLRQENRKARAIMLEMEELLEDHEGLYGVAVIVARAHMDVGMAWRGSHAPEQLPARNISAFHAHFAHATKLLKPYDPFELSSPLLAATHCTGITGHRRPRARLIRAYEDLLDLDPACPAHLRAFGNALLPANFGSYDKLDREAHRAAARTRDIWGYGGYTWMYLDTFRRDPVVLNHVEAETFVAGMHDIIERMPDQHSANLLAALSGVTLARHANRNLAAQRIRESFDWLVRDHLREVHALLWSDAQGDPALDQLEEPARIKAGRVRAFSLIADHFKPEIEAGNRILFESGNLSIQPDD